MDLGADPVFAHLTRLRLSVRKARVIYFLSYCFQEAKELLAGASPDADAMTRGQQKKIEEIQAEKPSPKKGKMSKQGTMAATAKVCIMLSHTYAVYCDIAATKVMIYS